MQSFVSPFLLPDKDGCGETGEGPPEAIKVVRSWRELGWFSLLKRRREGQPRSNLQLAKGSYRDKGAKLRSAGWRAKVPQPHAVFWDIEILPLSDGAVPQWVITELGGLLSLVGPKTQLDQATANLI